VKKEGATAEENDLLDLKSDEKALFEMKSDEKALFEMKSDEKALFEMKSDEKALRNINSPWKIDSTQKSHRQLALWVISPPMIGPMAGPSRGRNVEMASDLPRSAGFQQSLKTGFVVYIH
jgi:hypothetical protein